MKDIQRARRVLTVGRWFLIAGLVFYSLMTTTPFVAKHSEWGWSGWVLGLIVDAAFIMSLSADSTLATLGVSNLGRWPAAFRWFTGLSSVFLNVWVSVARGDWVGVVVHLIAPALVMLLAEVGPVYLAALARAEREAQDQDFAEQVVNELPMADWERELLEKTYAVPSEPRVEPTIQAVGTITEPEGYAEHVEQMTNAQMVDPADIEAHAKPSKLTRAEADEIIQQGWKHKLTVAEVAAAAQRHPATVRRKYKEFDASLAA